jgi:hypothetical protein
MRLHGLIIGDARGYKYKRSSGDVLEFNVPKLVELINTDPTIKEEMYQSICDKYIMQYRNPNSKIIEDVEETNTENDDITTNAVSEDEDAKEEE